MPSGAKATIHNDHTTGRTVLTDPATRVTIEVSPNRSFVMRSCRATTKVTNVTVVATAAVTMDDGEMAVFGPGK